VSGSEEETYSLMFSSLRHPARRKILRMLSERTMTFSKMLEELAIPSSHLTYHLENLGELVIKEKDGKYKLSSFGNAAVSMMKGAEEVPNSKSNRFKALPVKWKSLYAAFIIGIVLLASFAFIQFASYNQLAGSYDKLSADYGNIKAQNDRLLHWSPSGDKAMTIIQNVIQIDISKYQATLENNGPAAQVRTDLGGVVEEVFKYTLVNSQSSFELTLRFRDGHFSMFQLTQQEGAPNFQPIYTQIQPTDPLQITKALIERYKSVMNDTYLDEASRLLATAANIGNDQTLGNTKLQISQLGINGGAKLVYTENGTDFDWKSLSIKIENHILTQFNDDRFLYKVGSTQVNISKDEAILAVKNALKTFSWNSSGIQVNNFQVVDNPVNAALQSQIRDSGTTTLYPYWYVTLYLDKTYPGGVSMIAAGVWADTGKVVNMQALASA
jgi:DNA-binding transcriptional ArsR family regulator